MKKHILLNSILFVCFIILLPSMSRTEEKTVYLDSKMIWQDDSGKNVKLSDWQKNTVVLTMSYTSCRRICPNMTLKKLKELQEGYDKLKKKVEFIIVTFDPENDTPHELSKYKKKNKIDRNNWHFLTGTLENTKTFSEKLDLDGFWKMDDHVFHGFKIVVIGPNGDELGSLDWDHQDIKTLLKK